MELEFMYRLRMAMEKKGITASELSRISGVGKSDISYYLKGKYLPKQDKCYLLAKALDVDPGWLMTGVEPVDIVKQLNDFAASEDETPKNDDIRLLIRGLNQMSPEQIKQATDVMKIMFAKYFKEDDDET